MFTRVAVTAVLTAALACTKEPPAPTRSDASLTSGPRRMASTQPPPPDGPCASDADCKVYPEPCACGCLAYVGEPRPIPNDKWATVCSGSPPGNCGVASPCMNTTARCDPATKRCALKR